MPEISIVVPIYNVEKYLDKCIKSILNQTFQDLEVILVNDGSQDSCKKICEQYAKKDKRIKIINKKNGGLSDARNHGIEAAIGNYIGFIDSDDYIEENMYEILYNNLKKNNADISVCGYYTCYENLRIEHSKKIKEIKVMTVEESIKMIPIMSPGSCNKLYKINLFKNIKYPIGRLNEDVFILMDIFSKAKKIVFDPQSKYYYIQRSNSITKRSFDSRKWDCVAAWEKNLKFVNDNYPKEKIHIEYKFLGAYLYLLDLLILTDDYNKLEDYKKVQQFIRKNIIMILKNKLIIKKRKLAILIYLAYPPIYRKIILKLEEKRGLIN